MAIAVILTVALSLVQVNAALIFLGGIAPLVYYFIALLRLSKHGISQTATDSIYYFGFIVTIAALAASVLRVAFYGFEGDLSQIIAQFGVGLLATGLALVFRMVLVAKMESLNAKDLTEQIEEYVLRIKDVVAKVETSASDFEALSATLRERTEHVAEETESAFCETMLASQTAFRETMLASVQSFRTEIAETTRESNVAIKEFTSVVQKITLDGHVRDLSAQVGSITAGLRAFSGELSHTAKAWVEETHRSTQQALALSARAQADHLAEVTVEAKKAIQASVDTVKLADFSAEANTLKTELRDAAKAVNTLNRNMGALQQRVSETMVAAGAEALADITRHYSATVGAAVANTEALVRTKTEEIAGVMRDTLKSEMEGVADDVIEKLKASFTPVGTHLAALGVSLQNARLEERAAAVGETFATLSTEAGQFSERLTSAVDRIAADSAQKLETQLDEAFGRVALSWGEHVQTLGERVQALDGAIGLQNVVGELARLTSSVETAATAANGLATSVETAATAANGLAEDMDDVRDSAREGLQSIGVLSQNATGVANQLEKLDARLQQVMQSAPRPVHRPEQVAPMAT